MDTNAAWLDYWDGDVSLYVSRRHLEAHYQSLLAAIEPLLPPPPFTLLDFGCGEALMAPAIAAKGGRVILFDEAAARRGTLRQRFAPVPGIEVPDETDSLAGTCDMVLMISVIQYVPKDQLPHLLARIRRLLKPGGRLVLGDILAPDNSIANDALALLGFGLKKGFLVDAVIGLFKTLRSDYRQARQTLGLSTYSIDGILAVLKAAGFEAAPLGWNIGHARHRRSVMATRA
jgi:SAM-dependent methyltransferase